MPIQWANRRGHFLPLENPRRFNGESIRAVVNALWMAPMGAFSRATRMLGVIHNAGR